MSQDKLPESALQPPGGSQPTTPVWYKPTLGPRLTPLMQKMLEKYSGVPGEEIEEHVSEVVSFACDVSTLSPSLYKL